MTKAFLIIYGSIITSIFSPTFINHHVDSHRNVSSLVKDSLIWSAEGFIKVNQDKSIITLNGNAKFQCNAFSISADEIVFNKKKDEIYAKNYILKNRNVDTLVRGTFGTFPVKGE